MSMTVTFRPAVRLASFFMLGLAGPSGSGKTLSALRIARGLVGGDDSRIFFTDTEGGRGLHYAPPAGEQPGQFTFGFQYAELTAPFSPMHYDEIIAAAVQARAGVIIVDSMSHEHEGEGGILEWHDRELTQMAGQDQEKRDRLKFTAWIKPKQAHTRLLNKILQARAHFIFCFRAKDKIAPVKNSKGKTEFVSVGWTPICSDRFEYEMTTLAVLPPNSKGTPDLGAERTKLQEQHKPIFPAGRQLDEKTGQMIARWCSGKSLQRKAAAIQGGGDTPPPEAPSTTGSPPPAAAGDTEEPGPLREGPMEGANPASDYHPGMRQMYAELHVSLERAPDKRAWWNRHPTALAQLREQEPELYEHLREMAFPQSNGDALL